MWKSVDISEEYITIFRVEGYAPKKKKKNMKQAAACEMSVDFLWIMWHYIPEDRTVQSRHWEPQIQYRPESCSPANHVVKCHT
jgi:hypothetical protein